MIKNVLALGAFILGITQAAAQNVPNHAIPIGRGAGVSGFHSAAPGTSGNCLVSNGASADPSFTSCPAAQTGVDLTLSGTLTLTNVPLATTSGGTGASTISAARTNLGVPSLSGTNTFPSVQTFTSAPVFTNQSGTRTALGLATIAASGSASDLSAGTVPAARMPALTGDITTSAGAVATTLATVNSNVGSFGDATHVGAFTVNAKGLVTAASSTSIALAIGNLTVATANRLGVTNGSGVWGVGTVPTGLALGSSALTFDIPSLSVEASVDPNLTFALCETSGVTKKCTAGSLAGSTSSGVTNIGGATGGIPLNSGLSIVGGNILTSVWEKSSNNIYNNNSGNFGYGTSSPADYVTILGTSTNELLLSLTNSSAGTGASASLTVSNDSASLVKLGMPSSGFTPLGELHANRGFIYSQAPNGISILANDATHGDIVFASGGLTETARFTVDKKFGLGTATPTTKMQVVSFDNLTTTDIGTFLANNLSQGVAIGYNTVHQLGAGNNLFIDGGTGAGKLFFNNSATGDISFGNGGGSVSIGSVTITDRLSIAGSVAITNGEWYRWTAGAAADSGIDFGSGSTITRRSSDGHVRYTSQNSIHEMVGNLNVGIVSAADVFITGPSPWSDVKAFGACGCSSGDDTAAINAAIAQVVTSHTSGGIVYFPPGNYITAGLITVPSSVMLVGAGRNASAITNNAGDTVVLLFDGNKPGMSGISVYGDQSSAATAPVVRVTAASGDGLFENCLIWGGGHAIEMHGTDFRINNCFITGTGSIGGAIFSDGANWYTNNKIDTSGTHVSYAFFQGDHGTGAVQENHFINTDFSGDYDYSVFIDDAGTETSITVFQGTVMSAPVFINSARWTAFIGAELSPNITQNATHGSITITSSWGFGSVSLLGGTTKKTCSNNFQITC